MEILKQRFGHAPTLGTFSQCIDGAFETTKTMPEADTTELRRTLITRLVVSAQTKSPDLVDDNLLIRPYRATVQRGIQQGKHQAFLLLDQSGIKADFEKVSDRIIEKFVDYESEQRAKLLSRALAHFALSEINMMPGTLSRASRRVIRPFKNFEKQVEDLKTNEFDVLKHMRAAEEVVFDKRPRDQVPRSYIEYEAVENGLSEQIENEYFIVRDAVDKIYDFIGK